MSEVKKCPSCTITKPATEFYKKATSNDGLFPICKVCHREVKRRCDVRNKKQRSEYKKLQNAQIMADPERRALRAVGRRVNRACRRRGLKQAAPVFELLGCTKEQYLEHLRAMKGKLTWRSYTETWIVRHTLPPRTFNLSEPDEQFAAFNVSNMLPTRIEGSK